MTKEPLNRAQRRRIEREAKEHRPTFWDSTFNRIWVIGLAAVILGVMGYAFFFKAQPAAPTAATPPKPAAPVTPQPAPNPTLGTPTATPPAEAPKTDEKVLTKDTKVGKGPEVKAGDSVSVHYTGTLLDGTKFDSSLDRGQPLTFTIGSNGIIAGWSEGITGMKEGGKRTLTIPPALGYGKAGKGPKIPPDATLKFDIELVKIN